MKLEDFVKELKIPTNGNYKDENTYIVTLSDSNTYMQYYNIISINDLVTLDFDRTSSGDIKYMTIVYTSDEFDVILEANLDDDFYTITVKRGEESNE